MVGVQEQKGIRVRGWECERAKGHKGKMVGAFKGKRM